jgi:predicted alpha/beta-fold hydrolase
MKLRSINNFKPNILIRNPHFQTILPQYFQTEFNLSLDRIRLELADGDFLDLDFYLRGGSKLAIISHGLEGHSRRYYVREYAAQLLEQNYDVIAWNMRGCSGEANRLLRFYHSGESQDLLAVINYAVSLNRYSEISLIGFSVGGNVTLKLLGELGKKAQNLIKNTVVFSVPCDLKGSAKVLAQFKNKLYMRYFMKTLRAKLYEKGLRFPGQLDLRGLEQIKNFCQFDQAYTAPIHGFKSAEEYWSECSANLYIPEIQVPAILISSLDDPFLSESCYPVAQALDNKYFKLELSKYGGHMGFIETLKPRRSFALKAGLDFLSE